MRYIRSIPFLVVILSLLVFTFDLSAQEIIGFDARFYLFAQEMWRNGASWFPTTYGLPYADYPATATFLIYCFSLIFGELNKLTALIPTILMASVTMTSTYLIGRLHDERLGISAIFIMLLTLFFVKTIRSISLDMAVTAVTTISFYLFYAADYKQKKFQGWIFYFLIVFGFAYRGPLGLVIPVGVVCSYLLMSKQYQRLFRHGCGSASLLVISTIILMVLAYLTGGYHFLKNVWHMQIYDRLDNPYLPIYFYFTNSLGSYALAFPLAILVMIGVVYRYMFDKINDAEWLFFLLSAWVLIILLGLSVPDDKKVRYILPMLPACSLIAAYIFLDHKQRYFVCLQTILMWFCFILPTLLLFLIAIIQYESMKLFLIFSLLQCLQWLWFFLPRKNLAISLLGGAALTFVTANILILEPIQLKIDHARTVVQSIERMRLADHADLVFYHEGKDSLPIKYLINMLHYRQPIFIPDQAMLSKFNHSAYLITSQQYEYDLLQDPRLVKMTQNSLGHVKIVVFKLQA